MSGGEVAVWWISVSWGHHALKGTWHSWGKLNAVCRCAGQMLPSLTVGHSNGWPLHHLPYKLQGLKRELY